MVSKGDAQFIRKTGQNIRQRREAKKWSQEQIAELVDIHDRTVGKIERGKMNPTVLILAKLCRALGCQPNDIVPDLAL